MTSPLRILLLACLGCGLPAQAVNDLNSLVLQADRFIGRNLEPAARKPLSLFRLYGTRGSDSEAPMTKAVDIGAWSLVYQAGGALLGPPLPPGDSGRSVNVRFEKGLFTRAEWSPLPVFDCRSLEGAWFTVSLDAAIQELRRSGHAKGFDSLAVMRPLHPRYPDECTFVFKCISDRAFVGISARTGKVLWTESLESLDLQEAD
jgi:hypothetical protein